jgi:hypothetical protein
MTDREIMQQALEALEEINKLSIGENAICLPAEIDGALDALRDRLAQPEQVIDKSAAIRIATALGWEPRREWVGLTDEEIDTLVIGKDGLPNSHLEFARAIEAAHGIKGEA